MKKYLLFAALLFSFLATAQRPSSRPASKSTVMLPQATPPSNPLKFEQYRNLAGNVLEWNGTSWQAVNSGGGLSSSDQAKLNNIAVANNIDLDALKTLTESALQAEVDGSITNEIQTISDFSLSPTNILSITLTSGNTVTVNLSSLAGGTGGTSQTAAQVPYANTTSKLTATNAQGAIDELSSRQTIFNTAYIEDHGAIAGDELDDGTAIQAVIDLNKTGSIKYIRSRTAGKFILKNTFLNIRDVKNLDISLLKGSSLIATGNFPVWRAVVVGNEKGGDISVTDLSIHGFKWGSEYDANADGGVNGSKGGTYNGAAIANGATPNPINPALLFIGGAKLDGLSVYDCEITNPGTNGDGIKLHNESGTASSNRIRIENNYVHDMGAMFVEFANHADVGNARYKNIKMGKNTIERIGLFRRFGMAYSFSGTGKDIEIYSDYYEGVTIGVEILGVSDLIWRDSKFGPGCTRAFSISKNQTNQTALSKNISFKDIRGPYTFSDYNIAENVTDLYIDDSFFNGALEARHSDGIYINNSTFKSGKYGTIKFGGDTATNPLTLKNFKVKNSTIEQTVLNEPLLAAYGNQTNPEASFEGCTFKMVGDKIWETTTHTEPTYLQTTKIVAGAKTVIFPYGTGGTGTPQTLSLAGYYVEKTGNIYKASWTPNENRLAEIQDANLTAVLNGMKAELVAKRPGDPSMTITFGEGSFPIANFVWDLSGKTSNIYNGLTIKGQGGATNLTVSGAGNSGFILKNIAKITIENLNAHVAPAAESFVKSMRDGADENGSKHSTFRNLVVTSESESDVFQLVNPFYNLFDNCLISSKNGTPIHFRNQSTANAFGNSTIQNCQLFYGSGVEDQGIRTSSSTTFPNINDISIVNTKSLAYAGEAGENNGSVLSKGWAANFEAGTSISLINPDFEYGNGIRVDDVDGFGISGAASYILPKSSTGLVATGLYFTTKAKNVYVDYVKIDGAGYEGTTFALASNYTIPIVIENAPSYQPRIKIRGKMNGNSAVSTIKIGKDRKHDINMDVDGKPPFISVSNSINNTNIFEKALKKEATVNILITGDSRNDAYFHRIVEYATSQAKKANIVVNQNTLNGQSIVGWTANTSYFFKKGTLQEAIDLTPGRGENTVMVFSMGYNDATSTIAQYKTLIETALDAYLLAKPLAKIVMSTPYFSAVTQKNVNLKAAFLQIATERNYEYVDSQKVTEDVYNKPEFYWDVTHEDRFGGMRVINDLYEHIFPGNVLKAITLEDPEPYVVGPVGPISTIENGSWRSYDGLDLPGATTRRFKEIVNPLINAVLEVNATITSNTIIFLRKDNTRIFTTNLSKRTKGSGKYEITIPEETASIRINVASNGAAYDALNETGTVTYKQNPVTLTQAQINEGLTLTQPYVMTPTLSLTGTNNDQLSISGGNTVTLPTSGTNQTATQVPIVIAEATYTLQTSDNGKTILFTNPNGCILTKATGIEAGWSVEIVPYANNAKVKLNFLTNRASGDAIYAQTISNGNSLMLRYLGSPLNQFLLTGGEPYVPVVPNQYIGKAGSASSPDATSVANWVGSGSVTANTNAANVRTGTTSLGFANPSTDGTIQNVRYDGSPVTAAAGKTITITAWFKASSAVRCYLALESPNSSYQSETRGNGVWQKITLSRVSDGGATKFYLVNRPNSGIAGSTYWDDINLTISD